MARPPPATPSNPVPPRQPRPLALRIPCGPRVGAISQQEKFSALEREAEDPSRTVPRSFAATSARIMATLSFGDAAPSGEASAAVASAPVLLRPPRGGLGLESAVGGSAINLFTGFVALWLLSQGHPVAWAVAVHFAPLPYNAFLVRSLWRNAARPAWTLPCAAAWLVAMLVV